MNSGNGQAITPQADSTQICHGSVSVNDIGKKKIVIYSTVSVLFKIVGLEKKIKSGDGGRFQRIYLFVLFLENPSSSANFQQSSTIDILSSVNI